jgi:hypothetical protein
MGAMGILPTPTGALAPDQRAALLMDLIGAGVHAEAGERPYAWMAPPKAPEAPQPQILAPKVAQVTPEQKAARAVPLLAPRKTAAARAPGKAHVWAAGTPGGLVVAVRTSPAALGQVPLAGAELDLLMRMLKACGLEGRVDGWVGLGQMDDSVRPGMAAEMRAAVAGLAPSTLLVLGGAALGTLLGNPLGVEAWQTAPQVWDGIGLDRMGVTYPPQLLLEQPLFKRLAWQHLLAWQAGVSGGGAV